MADADHTQFASPVDYGAHGYYAIKPGPEPLYKFRKRISEDGSSPYAPEAGRYHLYLAIGCPWAQRAQISVELLGLDKAISHSLVDDVRDGRGWAFRATHGPDPVNGYRFLKDAYLATDPAFEGHVNVPSLYDRKTGRIVNNENDDIIADIITRFGALSTTGLDLYPKALRADIDALSARIAEHINTNVYRIGHAHEQADYDARVASLFATLDALEDRLAHRRYLFGDTIVESDIRLWVSLARFDVAYNTLFRANRRRLVDYPNLWAYARDLYSLPAFRRLTDFDIFKLTYYRAFPSLNPSGVLPAGPRPAWDAPQDRAALGGVRPASADRVA
jgi:putative glutathione S-transferase